jgi:hypothetical protein
MPWRRSVRFFTKPGTTSPALNVRTWRSCPFTRNDARLAEFRITASDLAATTWRDEMITHGVSRTQAFARRLMDEGYAALMVRSFARGASDEEIDIVLWRWSAEPPAKLVPIDDENRLAGAERALR